MATSCATSDHGRSLHTRHGETGEGDGRTLVVTAAAHQWEVREGASILSWAETREAILAEAAALSRRRENCPIVVVA